jgi:hypothetical protein
MGGVALADTARRGGSHAMDPIPQSVLLRADEVIQ